MSRKKKQAEVLVQFGALFGPLLKWAESPDSFEDDEKTRIFARYFSDAPKFLRSFQTFTQSEPGHIYRHQWFQVANAVGLFENASAKSTTDLCEQVRKVYGLSLIHI